MNGIAATGSVQVLLTKTEKMMIPCAVGGEICEETRLVINYF